MQANKQTLIAISVKSIQREPCISSDGRFLKSAVITGVSENPDVSFEIKTGLLPPEQVHRCELLQQHGSTVVEVPDNWRWEYNEPSRWQEAVIKAAMERVAKRYEIGEDIDMTGTYDSDFAEQVLVEINKHFPHAVQTNQLKHAFKNEPSDSALLTALAGLQRDGFIEGKTMFSSMTGRRELMAMANIEITAAGRSHLSGASAPSPTATIIQGDQFNNYGEAGAMGHHSAGMSMSQHSEEKPKPKSDGKKNESVVRQIIVGVIVALVVGGSAPYWWDPLHKLLFPPAVLIPSNMVGVWTGEIINNPDNGGSTGVCYSLLSDGSVKVYDDQHYKHPHPYSLSGIKASGDTIFFKLNIEGARYPGLHFLKLVCPGSFDVSISDAQDDSHVVQTGTLKHFDLSECPSN